MKCKHCGAEIPETSKFCNNCGKEIQEIKETNNSILQKDYLSFRTFFIKHKAWVFGYIAWVVIHSLLWLFGGERGFKTPYHNSSPAKDLFFPFTGEANNYDFTEFFVYVIAIPILAYIAYYFLQKKSIKLPKISLKVALQSFVLAFCMSLTIYAIAMKPVEHYKINFTDTVGFRHYYMDVAQAEIPSFLGDTYYYNPYKTLFSYRDYPLSVVSKYSPQANDIKYPSMPLLFRLRLALMILLSWKGLRFFLLMWLFSYGIVWYSKPILNEIRTPKKQITEADN